MFKYILIPALLVSLTACNQNNHTAEKQPLADSLHATDSALKPITADRLIVPGKRIGMTRLNGNADSLVTKLGKPDSGDAAMGAQMMTWINKHDTNKYRTTVYSHRNMGGADENVSYIKEIRVTSPWFKTADYAGAGSALKDIKKLYKLKMHMLDTYKKKYALYDDVNAGIAFEVDSTGKCAAVLIHAAGDSTGSYLNIR